MKRRFAGPLGGGREAEEPRGTGEDAWGLEEGCEGGEAEGHEADRAKRYDFADEVPLCLSLGGVHAAT